MAVVVVVEVVVIVVVLEVVVPGNCHLTTTCVHQAAESFGQKDFSKAVKAVRDMTEDLQRNLHVCLLNL